MNRCLVAVAVLICTTLIASVAYATDDAVAISSDESLVAASGDVEFLWPPTVSCPGPDDESIWQCFLTKNNGEDIAVESQAQNPDIPGFTVHATKVGVEAQLLCDGEPLFVTATSVDEDATTWFTFEASQYGNVEVSSVGLSIPNSNLALDGSYTGQLLACDEWPYENSQVSQYGGDGHGLKVTLETRNGSQFELELLIPYHWADGDYDDNRVVEDPPDDPPIGGGDARFLDVPLDHTFNADVEWLAAEGVTRGCDPPLNLHYCPDDPVTRGQMAAFLVRALGLPARGYDEYATFADVGSTHTFFDEVGILGAEGITRGCNPPDNSRFCPDDPVTRGQMAAFLVRALGLPPSSTDSFVDDDGSVFEKDIQALAASGITRGCNPPANSRFCPDEPVSRAQMAAFLHRALGQ